MGKRLSFGQWVDGSWRLRVSAAGFDVDTALADMRIVFDSSLNGYGVVCQTGTFNMNTATTYANTKIVSWANVGFKPVVYTLFGPTNARKTYLSQQQDIRLRVNNDGLYLTGKPGVTTLLYYAMLNQQVAA
ncbi:hypothetical protein [Pararhizobium qamdonense]|uniref:hypothetical protein n=1 Tax=Pararhizobium qamdonense TaxID=3031126 RepID=UPI0023E15C25|nr:hypothetical protein [Pararhizobium qamdonense]